MKPLTQSDGEELLAAFERDGGWGLAPFRVTRPRGTGLEGVRLGAVGLEGSAKGTSPVGKIQLIQAFYLFWHAVCHFHRIMWSFFFQIINDCHLEGCHCFLLAQASLSQGTKVKGVCFSFFVLVVLWIRFNLSSASWRPFVFTWVTTVSPHQWWWYSSGSDFAIRCLFPF